MRKIASFAARHYLIARVLIAVIHLLLLIIAVFVSNNLRSLGIRLSPAVLVTSLVAIGGLYLFSKSRNLSFAATKALFFSAGLCMFVGMIGLSNINSPGSILIKHSSAIHTVSENPPTKKQARKLIKAKLRELKQSLRADGTKAEKTILTILAVLLALAMVAGLAALACTIWCNASPVLAVLVALFGLAGIIAFTVWLIKKINKKE